MDIPIKKIIKIAVVVTSDGAWEAAGVIDGDVDNAFERATECLDYDHVSQKYLIEAEIDATHKVETVAIKGRTLVP